MANAPTEPPKFNPAGANARRVYKQTRGKNLMLGGVLAFIAVGSFAGQFYSYLKMGGEKKAVASSAKSP